MAFVIDRGAIRLAHGFGHRRQVNRRRLEVARIEAEIFWQSGRRRWPRPRPARERGRGPPAASFLRRATALKPSGAFSRVMLAKSISAFGRGPEMTADTMGSGCRRRRFLKSSSGIAPCSRSSNCLGLPWCRANTKDRTLAIVPTPDRRWSSEPQLREVVGGSAGASRSLRSAR
jgi:hypothetical protein